MNMLVDRLRERGFVLKNGYHITIKFDTTGFDDDQLEGAYDGLGRGSAGWHEMTDTLTLSKYIRDDDFRAATLAGMDVVLTSFEASGIEGVIRSMEVHQHEEATNQVLRYPPEFFIGTAETAEMLGVSKQRVSELAKTHADFPEPIKRLKSGPVYDRQEMAAWDANWERRRTGRPRRNASQH
jgi:hypothetical protein